MNQRLRALLKRKSESIDAAKAITDAAAAANRDLTDDERKAFDGHMADVERLAGDVKREEALAEAARSAGAIVLAGDAARVTDNIALDPKGGFKSFGHFAQAVIQASTRGTPEQLHNWQAAAPSTYGSEGTGADGGFLIPPEFSRDVYQHSLEEGAFLPLTDEYPVQGNSLTFPVDETTPWGTDGVRAYWETEASAATATKPKGRVSTLRTQKLMALVPVSDELLQDANALEAYIGRKTSDSIRWKTNLALVAGTGVGQPKGWFLSGGPFVSVAKETGQTAATVVAANVAKMFGRLPSGSVSRAVWMLNNDVFNQLPLMTIGQMPVWTPPSSGMKDAPNGLLLGRPIMLTQTCQTLGTQGDIALVDWKAYRTITKGGIQTATSMHLYFDAGATAFRATFRIDGQPAIQAAITPANGSSGLSPFVVLDTRA